MATAYNVKFMFADATVIEEEFAGGVTVIDAKLKLIGSWPEGKEAITSPENLKMIYSGKVLENAKTFEDYKIPMRQQVVMHLQPKPAAAHVETVATPPKPADSSRCCTIL